MTENSYFKYKLIGNNRDLLVIILPSAGATEDKLVKLVKLILSFSSVLLITGGYFGLEYEDKKSNFLERNSEHFVNALTHLVESLHFNKIILLGSSVGGVHAVKFYMKYKNKANIKALVLGSPSLPLDKTLSNKLTYLFLHLLLINPFGSGWFFDNFFRIVRRFTNEKVDTLTNMNKKLGTKNFLLCLKEIFLFCWSNSPQIRSILKEKGYILVGDSDLTYKYWVNPENFKNIPLFKYINADHDVLHEKPEEFVSVIKEII